MNKYIDEKQGQISFYERFLPRINPDLSIEDILSDNNDGVLNGNLIEFKKATKNLNEHLFQCIKYLSVRRIKGKPVPAGIVIVDLSVSTAWYYSSQPYLEYIEKVYNGAASKNNVGFVGERAEKVFHYDEEDIDTENLILTLKQNNFIRIHIDENCVVGWATTFYNAVPNSRKEDFIGDDSGAHKTIGEIRRPKVFADYIYPYTGETNIKFKYLLDKLNDTLMKKNTGAFYTHKLYAEKASELVKMAVERVPEGNDYIILDRCAGTGNLEENLKNIYDKNGESLVSHCIVSTIEYYEYKVLQENIGSMVRHIIPPIETDATFNAGFVSGADALSKEYIFNPVIRQYIDNPKCTIILFENPPYIETTSVEHQKRGLGAKSSSWKNSFVASEMKKEVKGTACNDMGNAFIWSAFKYYLRFSSDSYIVFSPVKYWKAQHLINKQFHKGYGFNRRHFHTNIDACIMCALWSQEYTDLQNIEIDAFDIDVKTNTLLSSGKLPVKRIHTLYSKKYYDKRCFEDDTPGTVVVGFNGLERPSKDRIVPKCNTNIVGYMTVETSGFDNPDLHASLVSAPLYNAHGFYLRKDNYLEKLPMFAASRYITYNRQWTERARIMKSADGAERFFMDVRSGKLEQYLLKVLLFTCMETQNHMRSFVGSDGRLYKNELCLDNSNGKTIAVRDLIKLSCGVQENQIIKQWEEILYWAKQTKNYDPSLTYGVYQISDELDTSQKDVITGETHWDYKELHSALQTLKQLVKNYYNTEIVPTLFEYEFLK